MTAGFVLVARPTEADSSADAAPFARCDNNNADAGYSPMVCQDQGAEGAKGELFSCTAAMAMAMALALAETTGHRCGKEPPRTVV